MDLLIPFTRYLSQQSSGLSARTVQLYENDVSRFITWYEHSLKRRFHPQEIEHNNISAYFSSLFYSKRTIERHSSSIRRFFHFLVSHGYSQDNPLLSTAQENVSDPWRLQDFGSYLYIMNYSPITIKHYKLDLKHFFAWVENTAIEPNVRTPARKNISSIGSFDLIQQYKNYLLQKDKYSPSLINRRLAALKKYYNWSQL